MNQSNSNSSSIRVRNELVFVKITKNILALFFHNHETFFEGNEFQAFEIQLILTQYNGLNDQLP